MRKSLVLVLAAVLILGLASVSLAKVLDPKVEPGQIGKYGGTFVDYSINDPKTFNLVTAKETSSTGVLSLLVFEGLTEVNYETMEIEPALAKSWKFSDGGKVCTFQLRRGVTWQDGQPFTADDVVFSYQMYFDPAVGSSTRDVFMIDGQLPQVKKIDTYTVQFILPKPFAPFLVNASAEILPKHKLEKAYKEGKLTETWGINTPVKEIVGTGPWRLADFKPGQRLVYTRNPNYWRVDKAGHTLPYLTRYIIEIVPNLETASLKFRSGELSAYEVRGEEYRLYKQGEKQGNYTVYNGGPTYATLFLVFNQNPNVTKEPKLSWFTNVKFRQALAYAIDKKTMIETIYDGNAVPQWAAISPAQKYYSNPKVKEYPYDLKKAQAVLAEAGFKKDAQGVLRDPKGNAVEFVINTNSGNSVRERALNIISEDFKKLGIKAIAQPMDFNKLVENLTTPNPWDAILIGLTGTYDPNGSSNTFGSWGGLHMWWPRQKEPATQWEARIDELMRQGAVTMEPSERRKIYFEVQDILAEQVPMIYTVTPTYLGAIRNTFGNAKVNAAGGYAWNSWQLFIKK
ncbi:MAG: ABC transporter substrate-binding protein [Firmicutes bacterium]|nr:ABC transporter substrate-binding protein [Bacillota bacterium]